MRGPVVIVGGGVIGLCCAYSLRKRGAEVVVVEASKIGAGASHGNAGWIVPSRSDPLPAPGLIRQALRSMLRPSSPVYIKPRFNIDLLRWLWVFWRHCNDRDHLDGLHAIARLAEPTMDLYDELARDGVRFEMWNDGLLFVFRFEEHAKDALARLEPIARYGYELPDKIVGAGELQALEPALSDRMARAGFLLNAERHVHPGSLMQGMTARLRELGVEILENATVSSLDRSAKRVVRVRTSAGDVHAGHVLLAAGSWTPGLARGLGLRIPLQAGKGYSFTITPERLPARPLALMEAKVGCTPFGDYLRVAGTMELSGVNTRIDPKRVAAIAKSAAGYLTGWDGCAIQDVWTGMRPLAPDGLPVLGRLGEFENVTVATGHAMLGVTLGPATGEAMAELILTDRLPDVLRAFGPERFGR